MKQVTLTILLMLSASGAFAQFNSSNSPHLYHLGGNIGIGVQNPGYTLSIEGGTISGQKGLNFGDTNSRIYFRGNRALEGGVGRLQVGEGYSQTELYNNVRFFVDSPTNSAVGFDFYNGSRRLHAYEAGGMNARPLTLHAQEFSFVNDSQTLISLDQDGNLAIGNSTALAKLHVDAPVGFYADNGTKSTFKLSYNNLPFANHFIGSYWDYNIENPYTGPSRGGIHFKTAGSHVMSVTQQGGVVVGSNSTASSFAVIKNHGSQGTPMVDLNSTGDGDVLYVRNNSMREDMHIAKFLNSSGTAVGVRASGDMYLPNGSVSITKNSGNTLLNLYGSNNKIVDVFNDGGRGRLRLYRTGGTAHGQLMHDGTDFTISSTAGKVKILNDAVFNEKIEAKQVKVSATPGSFPDYVFKEDYNLMSIDQLSNFIEKNGHLPNIPTAKEVETNGQDLGDIQKKLLEKIEELTLYVIQLERNNLRLERQNVEFKSMLKTVIDRFENLDSKDKQ